MGTGQGWRGHPGQWRAGLLQVSRIAPSAGPRASSSTAVGEVIARASLARPGGLLGR
jgi:hypothetical protein